MAVETVPNHHAAHPPFTGVGGYVGALTMVAGRGASADLAVELAALEPGDVVVDIGCGPGAAVRRAAARGAAEIVGVDPSPPMLRVARLLTRSRKVRYVEGAAERLPLPDGAATVAWSIACVHHWHDVDAGVAEVRRVLRPGGRFVAIERARRDDASGHASHGWTPAQAAAFAAACRAAGFDDVREERRDGLLAVVARAVNP